MPDLKIPTLPSQQEVSEITSQSGLRGDKSSLRWELRPGKPLSERKPTSTLAISEEIKATGPLADHGLRLELRQSRNGLDLRMRSGEQDDSLVRTLGSIRSKPQSIHSEVVHADERFGFTAIRLEVDGQKFLVVKGNRGSGFAVHSLTDEKADPLAGIKELHDTRLSDSSSASAYQTEILASANNPLAILRVRDTRTGDLAFGIIPPNLVRNGTEISIQDGIHNQFQSFDRLSIGNTEYLLFRSREGNLSHITKR